MIGLFQIVIFLELAIWWRASTEVLEPVCTGQNRVFRSMGRGRAIIAQQSTTDFHMDRVEVGVTPSKRRRICNEDLNTLCMSYQGFDNKLEYLYAVAKHFGNDPGPES
jgi:hypothetical protein